MTLSYITLLMVLLSILKLKFRNCNGQQCGVLASKIEKDSLHVRTVNRILKHWGYTTKETNCQALNL